MTERIGWALIHSIWQGAAVAGLLAVAFAALRHSASARYLAACAAMAAMLAAPVITFFVSGEESLAAVTNAGASIAAEVGAGMPGTTGAAQPGATLEFHRDLPFIVWLWVAGVAALSVRLAAGLVAVKRMRASTVGDADAQWQATVKRLAERLEVRRAIALVESAAVEVPTVIGWLRPVILMPASAVLQLSPAQLEALLAHEIAHIRRHDYLVNLLQSVVETLLFYHPAVWWIGRALRVEREHCCDDLAVSVCGDAAGYARALTRLEEIRGGAPALALGADGGSLLGRVRRLLTREAAVASPRVTWVAGLITLSMIGAMWSGSNLWNVNAQSPAAPVAPRAPQKPSPQPPPAAPAARVGAIAPLAPQLAELEVEAPEAPPVPDPNPAPEPAAAPEPQAPAAPPAPPAPPAPGGGFMASMESAGMKNLNIDQLVAFRIHGVSAEYISRMKAAGFAATPDQLVAMRIHGVTPEFAQEMKAAGYPDLSIDKLVACRIHGVNPKTVAEIKQLGFPTLTIDQIMAARIHGVTPEHLRGLKEAGFADLSFDRAVAARIHGVTPQFAKAVRDTGFAVKDFEELLGARIHGVTPEFIAKAQKMGFKDLTFDKIVRLKQFNIIE